MAKSSKQKHNIVTAQRLVAAMDIAIDNMIAEIQKPVDQELSGSQRKAELQSIKITAVDAKELIVERERLEQLITTLKKSGQIKEEQDYSGGFAEKFSK
tara:strand:+ start:2512 stop:2808 length:297 start_codon:yes stop_codon:yes gene_type:complete